VRDERVFLAGMYASWCGFAGARSGRGGRATYREGRGRRWVGWGLDADAFAEALAS